MSDKLFELEYQYIKETVHQAVEDRYRFLNFYIAISTAVATAVAGLVSLDTDKQQLLAVLGGLCLGISAVGIIFLLMMIRIRLAWYHAIIAMNKLKISFYKPDELQKLPWGVDSLPKPGKLATIHFYSALLTIIISSTFASAGISFILARSYFNSTTLSGVACIWVGLIATQVWLYLSNLRSDS